MAPRVAAARARRTGESYPVADFAAWSRTTGNTLVEQNVADNVYRFVLRRK